MTATQRRIVASLVIILFLAFWIWAASTIGTYLATGNDWVMLVFFVVAGIGWALPLRPILHWMNQTDD
ncbi:MAG: DUF2842 domain-containing protein [Pseudomonadota bacterium]